ncbi:hypothetical protein [Methylobacterium sp. ID0610]|uniref:hypothetical protein n=1 Tax=Methylobacterium carpenticola TaxID=3344827 RepID=UPI0036822B5D
MTASVVTVSLGVAGLARNAPAGTSIDSKPGKRLPMLSASSSPRIPGVPLGRACDRGDHVDGLAGRHGADCEHRRELLLPDGLGEIVHRQEDPADVLRRHVEIGQNRVENLGIGGLQRPGRNADDLARQVRDGADMALGRQDEGNDVPAQNHDGLGVGGWCRVAAHDRKIGPALLERLGAPGEVAHLHEFKVDAGVLNFGDRHEGRDEAVGGAARRPRRDPQVGVRRPEMSDREHASGAEQEGDDEGETSPSPGPRRVDDGRLRSRRSGSRV